MKKITLLIRRSSNVIGLFTILMATGLTSSRAQDCPPVIEWQKSLGGSLLDKATATQQTIDGGYIAAGSTLSDDLDIDTSYGGYDIWIVKLDASGNLVWQKSFGGAGNDRAFGIEQTTDGGFIVAGSSDSTDGDVTGNHGGDDVWVVKLDALGNLSWEKSLGGSGFDRGLAIEQTTDGGFVVGGTSTSTDGDVSGNNGAADFWVVKLDEDGTLAWQKSLGGTLGDTANAIQQTTDGGYIVVP